MRACINRWAERVVLAATAGILVAFGRPEAWPVAAPFVLLWALSPLVARWVSLPARATGAAATFSGGRSHAPPHGTPDLAVL